VTSTSLPENYPRYYTPGQVAAWAGVTSMTIIRWCDAGVLKAVTTPGGHRRITEESVREYLTQRGLPIPPEFGPKRAPAPPRMILVDDEPRTLRAVANRFRKFIEVTAFSDGYRAMAAACAEPPSVLLLDMIMPEMNGERVLRALRDEPRTSKLTIICWSNDPTRLEVARAAGATHAFLKDDVDEVEKLLKTLVPQQAQPREVMLRR
jgi:excisionase family DNA binding protein